MCTFASDQIVHASLSDGPSPQPPVAVAVKTETGVLWPPSVLTRKRTLTTMATRAVVYESNGNPASVLSVVTCSPPPKPAGSSVTVKYLLSPINPSDINAVEGVYPYLPTARQLDVGGRERTLHIPGKEGLGEITDVGEGVKGLKKGDWVVFGKSQSGTWSSGQTLEEGDVIKVDRETGISAVNAATLVVRSAQKYSLGLRRP